jgi:hypothetical protein
VYLGIIRRPKPALFIQFCQLSYDEWHLFMESNCSDLSNSSKINVCILSVLKVPLSIWSAIRLAYLPKQLADCLSSYFSIYGVPSIAYIYFVICTHFFQTCSICNPSSLEGTRIKHWTDEFQAAAFLKSAIKARFSEPVGKAVVHIII